MVVSATSVIEAVIDKKNKSQWKLDPGSKTVIPDLAEINGARLWDNILQSALIGGIPGTTGMDRLALSHSDKLVRKFFIACAK